MISIIITPSVTLFHTTPTPHTHMQHTQVKLQLLGEGATPLWVTDLINSGMIVRLFVYPFCPPILYFLFFCMLLLIYLSLLHSFLVSLLLSLKTYIIFHVLVSYSYTILTASSTYILIPSRDADGSAQIL